MGCPKFRHCTWLLYEGTGPQHNTHSHVPNGTHIYEPNIKGRRPQGTKPVRPTELLSASVSSCSTRHHFRICVPDSRFVSYVTRTFQNYKTEQFQTISVYLPLRMDVPAFVHRTKLSCFTTANTDSMFCWPYIIVYQCNETNVMKFSLNLWRIKGHYMFRALLAHPQEAIHKRHLVYCMRITSVGCGTVAVSLHPCHSQLTLYASNIPSVACLSPLECNRATANLHYTQAIYQVPLVYRLLSATVPQPTDIIRKQYTKCRLCIASWVQPCHSQLTLYASNIPSAACLSPLECNRTTANWHYTQAIYQVPFVHNLLSATVPQPTDIIRRQYTKCRLCITSWVQPCHSQLTLYASNIPSAVCASPPEDEQVMLEACSGPWFSINWMKMASRWFYYTEIQIQPPNRTTRKT
jgi:hypothetical protein